jgi:hypothetical protein
MTRGRRHAVARARRPAARPGLRLALFPQEWYRDDASAWLAKLPSDAPWHDPRLFAAMVRLRAQTTLELPAGAHRTPAP